MGVCSRRARMLRRRTTTKHDVLVRPGEGSDQGMVSKPHLVWIQEGEVRL